jgi:soluble lytic murein transglycosylase-like protein
MLGYAIGGFMFLLLITVMAQQLKAASPRLQKTLRWKPLAEKYGSIFGVDPKLVLAIIKVESAGDELAKNPSDPSAGLMQITPPTARAFGKLAGTNQEVLTMLLDPDTNVRAGTAYLAHLQNRYAKKWSVEVWTISYNAGETNFNKGFRNDYGNKVKKALEEISA